MTDEFTLPPTTDPLTAWREKTSAPALITVTGVLGLDDIEGGCAFLETPDGTRFEVVYPDGWAIDRVVGALSGPGGEVVEAGNPLTVEGSIVIDRSSICQIGPILLATRVALPSD